jgi:hypothetical protein
VTPAAATAGWQRPARLVSPVQLDVFGSQLAFASDGTAAVGYDVEDVDDPSGSHAFAVQRGPAGKLTRPHRFAGAQQALSLAFNGIRGEALTGTSPPGLACCSSVQAVPLRGGRAQTLVKDLAGVTAGRLIAFGSGLLATIASQRGVWVTQSSASGRFGRVRRLAGANVAFEAVDATTNGAGQSVVAWAGGTTSSAITSIFAAGGSSRAVPAPARREITVRPSHLIDELALASGRRAPTVAWIESSFDAAGRFRSQAMAADLTRPIRPRRLSPSGELTAGVNLAADAKGDQAVAWKACGSTGACIVRASLRPAGARFGTTQRLGSIDASEAPAVTVSPTGEALIGWVHSGHVVAASGEPRDHRFGSAHTVSTTTFATDLTLAFGPSGNALAVWTQGTFAQVVMGAIYSPR